eukprot:sb/3468981/
MVYYNLMHEAGGRNYAAALAPNRIQRAVTKASIPKPDEEDRSRNMIVFGLPEEADGVSVDTTVTSLLLELDEKPPMNNCVRLGTAAEGKVRPVKVSFESRDSLLVVLRKASVLRSSENFKRVYLEPDRSYGERVERRRAVKTLNELRQAHPERKYVLRNACGDPFTCLYWFLLFELISSHGAGPRVFVIYFDLHCCSSNFIFSSQAKSLPSLSNQNKCLIFHIPLQRYFTLQLLVFLQWSKF